MPLNQSRDGCSHSIAAEAATTDETKPPVTMPVRKRGTASTRERRAGRCGCGAARGSRGCRRRSHSRPRPSRRPRISGDRRVGVDAEVGARRLGQEGLHGLAGLDRVQSGDPFEDQPHDDHRAGHDQPPRQGHLAGSRARGRLGHGVISSRGGDHESVAVRSEVDEDPAAVADGAADQQLGQRVADRALDQAAQRAGAVRRVVAGLGEPGLRGGGDLDRRSCARPAASRAGRAGGRRCGSARPRVSASNWTISSSRLRNSGLNDARTAASTDSRFLSGSSVGSTR